MVWTTFISGLTTWLSVVTIFTSLPVSVITQCSGTWGSCLPNSNCHQVDWTYIQASDDIEITMKANIATTEWIGVGLSEDKTMPNADTYVGWVNASSGETTLLDGKATGKVMPATDTSQNVTNIEGSQTDGITTIKFRRKKTTTDTNNDFQFSDTNCPYFLYAKGGTYDDTLKTFTQHTVTPVSSTAKICVICPNKLGGSCNNNTDCGGDNVECSSNLCKCESGFYDNNGVTDGGSCEAKVTNGGSCQNLPGDACASNLQCDNGFCSCLSNQYWSTSSNTCVNKVTNGGSCQNLPGDACASNLQCNNVCSCLSNQYWSTSSNTCVNKVTNGGSCLNLPADACASNLQCNNNVCSCSSNQYWSSSTNTCLNSANVGFNSMCDGSTSVCDTTKSLECVTTTSTTKQCKCMSGLYHSGDSCRNNAITNLRVLNLQATAISQTEIRVNWSLPSHTSVISRYEVLWTGNAVPRLVTPSTTTTYTIDKLTPDRTYSVRVTSVDTTSRLTEQKTYPPDATATTDALKGFDESCSSTVKCDESKNLGCLISNTQPVCKCIQSHYYSGSICSNTLDNLKVRSPSAVANSQTQVTISWGSPIASTAVNAIEVSWTPSHGESQPKSILITSTSTTISGLQGGTDYIITVTSKDSSSGSTTISQSVNVNVKTKSALGGSCSSVNNCDGSYVECVASKCQCQENYYDDNNALAAGTCKPISELRVTNVQVTVHDTTSVNVAWTNPSATVNSAIESKQVNWTGTTTASKNIAVTDTSTTVTGLTPGGGYTFRVVSIDSNSRTSSQEVSYVTAQVTTKPAAPGKIGSIVPDNTGYQVTLSWIASAGVVTHYSVVFDGGNGDTHTQTTSNNIGFITMISLTPGRRYNITITAVSGSMTSDSIYGNTRTTVIAPSAPINLKCDTIMDTSVTLSWIPPVNPNGDIMYYSVNVISGPGSPRTVNTTTPTPTKEIDKLTEESYYSFTVRARNDKYSGPQSMSATCKTKPGLPSKPQNVVITAVLSRDFNVSWMKPNSTKGSLIGYRIAVNNGTTCSKEILYQCSNCLLKPSFTSNCHVDSKITIQITAVGLNNDSFIQRVEDLFPYISYSVSVNAIIIPGDGYKETVVVKTKEEAPQDLTRVSVDILNSTSMKVNWNIPNPRPGVTKYSIDVIDVIDGEQTLNKSVEVQGFYERSTILTNLEEYWQYVINIKALTSIGQSAVKTITPNKTLPAAPGKVADFKVSRPDRDYKTVIVTWSIPSLRDRNSMVTSYEFTHNGTGTLSSKTLTHSANIEELFTESIIVQPGNYYYVEVFAINNNNQSGVKSSELYYAPSDQSTSDSLLTGVVAGSTVTVAVIILLVIVIVLITRKRKHNSKNRKDENYDDLQMSPYVNQGRVVGEDKTYTSLFKENKINRYRPVILSNIYQIVMEMHTDSDLKFAKEFQDLETLSPKEQCKTAKLQNNRRKNRDQKILPFDSSRVKFIEDKTNYINASHLQNLKNNSSHDFIVTQHPLSNTIDDFWTMIWEQNVSVIVMLTPKKEDGQVSYDTYFSSEPQSSKQNGSINVETMMKCFIQKTELSSIRLKKGKKSRIIKHFHSFGWNDRYDRSTQKEVVQLIEAVKSNVTQSDKLGPIVVHCGLGTGRSGVYIALYQLMDCIHDNNVDIFDLVLTMRESRMQLVECESQYIFIYDCFLYMISKKKTNHSTSQDQATGDTYEYIHIK